MSIEDHIINIAREAKKSKDAFTKIFTRLVEEVFKEDTPAEPEKRKSFVDKQVKEVPNGGTFSFRGVCYTRVEREETLNCVLPVVHDGKRFSSWPLVEGIKIPKQNVDDHISPERLFFHPNVYVLVQVDYV